MSALPSSSSSLMLKRKREFTHGIFLSFHGKDTRKRFTGCLYSALTRQGIETFRDDKSLKKGKDFAPELLRAIRESWGSIIVISKTYAFSRWCLEELVEIMKQRKERGHEVYPIFYRAPPSDFRHQINRVKEAFDKHEERYNKETTEAWRDALKQVTAIHGWSLQDQYESDFIDDIVKNVSEKFDAEVLDEEEVEKMKETFQKIQAWLVDAENEQCMKQGEAVKVRLDKLKHIAYDMDDVLDEWNTAVLKSKIEKDHGQTPSTSTSFLNEVCSIPLRIKELNKKYQDFVREEDNLPFPLALSSSCTDEPPKQTVSLVDESYVYGRNNDKDALIRMLLSDDNGEGGSGNCIPLLAIVGMGGLGKTTLAKLAYNNDEVKKHFHQTFWVCVSNSFNEVRIAKAILEALEETPSSFNNLEKLLEEIRKKIAGEKFLLVLDDVWTEDEEKWEPLKLSLRVGSQESKILVTTRKKNVASIMGCPRPLLLEKLSDEDSWSFFSKIAFFGRSYQDCETLESIGRECVKKCKGLPLAIKTLAGLLRSKKSREQWQRILDSPMWQLDTVEKDLFSPLLLSYYDLPSRLRQCFSYCAVFPKHYVTEKDLLIKLWMAQGFLGEGNKMEIVGEEYFDNLATRSFFQEFEYDDSIIIECKMHDIVHDFAQLLRRSECCAVRSSGIYELRADSHHESVRHLTLIRDDYNVRIPESLSNVKKLRSLLVDSGYDNTSTFAASLPKLLGQLTCLRMLSLNCRSVNGSIKKVPQQVGKLIHLRYLCLEGNSELVELPEALCDLCNLQTLNIRSCPNLQKLPGGMEKLINLRHLQNERTWSLTFMPKGMQRLTCLQTLELLNLEKKGGNESESSFRLTDLGNLIHLRGSLTLNGLGSVGEAEVSEAREAPLSTKAGLRELTLNFGGGYYKERQRRIEDEASVLQALEPPQQLQYLLMHNCKGPAFPIWMTSLTSLKSVSLCRCLNWESLPPMGKLPYLETLYIERMRKVKKVGEEFLGLETSTFSSSSVNHNNIIAFPSLKILEFRDMKRWEEWEYDENVLRSGVDDSSSSSSSSSSNITTITVMPKLQRLYIAGCPQLKTLPRQLLQSRALQQLMTASCPILKRRFNEETGEDWPSICHIPDVYIW